MSIQNKEYQKYIIEINVVIRCTIKNVQGEKVMRLKIKSLIVFALTLCMLFSMPVMAQDLTEVETSTVSVVSVPTGYTLVGNYTRTPQTYSLGTTLVYSTSTFQLYLPKNSNKDLMQGTVNFIPVTSGAVSGSFNFTNMSGEYKTFNLSSLTPGATYRVTVYGYAMGSSNKATAYYKMNL